MSKSKSNSNTNSTILSKIYNNYYGKIHAGSLSLGVLNTLPKNSDTCSFLNYFDLYCEKPGYMYPPLPC